LDTVIAATTQPAKTAISTIDKAPRRGANDSDMDFVPADTAAGSATITG
jgi:hypothetical protein